MRVILLGNAGAGKSTLSKKLIAKHPAARLSLDEVTFQGGTERRPVQESVTDVQRWIADKESWIIEGCYSDIIEPILNLCDELIFLNPGVDACAPTKIVRMNMGSAGIARSTNRFVARSVSSLIRASMNRYRRLNCAQ